MEEVGCTSPFGINIDNICTDTNKSKEAIKLYNQMIDKRQSIKKCEYPCQYTRSTFMILKMNKNATKSQTFTLEFDKYIKVTRAYYSYTGLELIAEFGGYVGLFLGMSVFHLSEAFEKIVNYFIPH